MNYLQYFYSSLYFLCCAILLGNVSYAQQHFCANPDPIVIDKATGHLRQMGDGCRSHLYGIYGNNCGFNDCSIPPLPNSGCPAFKIPVVFTIITDGSGNTTLDPAFIDQKIIEINAVYQAASVEFVQCQAPRYLDDADFYQFYFESNDAGDDGQDDGEEIASYDIPNVMNVYLTANLFRGTDSYCGYGYFPTTYTTGPSLNDRNRVYLKNSCFAPGDFTFEHEVGHYLGLQHPHRGAYFLNATGGTPNEAADGSGCCNYGPPDTAFAGTDPNNPNNKGDGICDTPPDPGLLGQVNNECVYIGSYTPSPSQPLQLNNIMGYSNYGACEPLSFTPCQLRKIHDVLTVCRDYLCCSNIEQDFSSTEVNHPQSPYWELCIGDGIPTLQAKNSCYNWYQTISSTVPLASTTSSFTPTASIVDINTPGTYEVWLEETNSFYLGFPCRRKATIKVYADPGNGVALAPPAQVCCNESITFTTSGMGLSSKFTVGFWLASTPITDPSGLDAAYAAGQIFRPDASTTTANGDTTFVFTPNCSNFPVGNYFITPFASYNDLPAPPIGIGPGAAISIPDNDLAGIEIPITVSQVPVDAILQQVCLYVPHAFTNDLAMSLIAPSGYEFNLLSLYSLSGVGEDFGSASQATCFVEPGSGYDAGPCNGPNPPCYVGTLNADGSVNVSIGDPNGNWTLKVADGNNPGYAGMVDFVELVFDQASINISFPEIVASQQSSCTFGTAIPFEIKDCTAAPSTILQLQAYLQGTYSGSGNMNSSLNAQLPISQPYNQAPWNYSGSEVVSSMSFNAVDWVLVELRSNANASSVVAQKAAILLSDGSIVAADNSSSGLIFNGLATNQNYYVVLKHRNHLGIISANSIYFPDTGVVNYSFSAGANQVMGSNQTIEIETGIFALRAGDFYADGIFSYKDSNVFANNSNSPSYSLSDVNLDGVVDMSDFNLLISNMTIIGIDEVR